MNKAREHLISQLVEDTGYASKPLRLSALALVWLLLGTLLATGCLLVVAPFRPGFLDQLLTVPRFSLEMMLGSASLAALVVMALRMSVPGATKAASLSLLATLPLLWLATLVVSLYYPVMDLGTLGMRSLCWLETLLYGLPIMLLGFRLVSRGYVLHWTQTGFLTGLVSGFFPGLLMQLACMYEAKHALTAHIGPAFLLALLGGLIGMILMQWRSRRSQAG